MSIRGRLKSGQNLDPANHHDPTKEEHQKEVPKYMSIHKPLVVILGSSCTSFGHWSHLSRVMHPEIWSQSRKIGEGLAEFAAKVRELQLKCNRRFILENPAGSGIFSLACFKELWGSDNLVSINAPQCGLGPK